MRARLTYLALRPSAPRRAAQTITEGLVLLLAIVAAVALAQIPTLVVYVLTGTLQVSA